MLTTVMGYLALKAVFAFADKFLGYGQLPALGTEIGIRVGQIGHVFLAANVLFPFSCLALLVVVWLYKGTLLVCFKIKVVLLALIASICHNITVALVGIAFHFLQKGNQGCRVRWLRPYRGPGNKFGIRTVLDVIGRL